MHTPVHPHVYGMYTQVERRGDDLAPQVAGLLPNVHPVHVYTCASSCVWHVRCMYTHRCLLELLEAKPLIAA